MAAPVDVHVFMIFQWSYFCTRLCCSIQNNHLCSLIDPYLKSIKHVQCFYYLTMNVNSKTTEDVKRFLLSLVASNRQNKSMLIKISLIFFLKNTKSDVLSKKKSFPHFDSFRKKLKASKI